MPRFDPMLALAAAELPTGAAWSYEVKWDGYRALIEKRGAQVTLHSRRGANFTRTYPDVVAAARRMVASAAVIDGEIVALDGEGRPSFQSLQHRSARQHATIAFYAFDILSRDGRDLTGEMLQARRRHLAAVVRGSGLLLSEPLPGTAAAVSAAVRAYRLEGVVAKRLDSRYESGQRSGAWTKVKFGERDRFLIGGFRADGRRVDALVVGYRERRTLFAAGTVRAGLTPLLRRQLFERLSPLATAACPFENLPNPRKGRWGEGITADDMPAFTWVRPTQWADITFTEWTSGGSLRHAAFAGLSAERAF